MKYFLFKFALFLSIIAAVIVLGIFLPPTPRASTSLLFAKINKDSLLKNVKSPRIIFIGGSNLSFGLNSEMIKNSLHLNPINTSIMGSIGLIYMMDSTLPYIQSGDIVVLAPEYYQYFGDFAYGSGEETLRIIMDVSRPEWTLLRKEQWAKIIPFLPKYSISKFKLSEYINIVEDDIYGVNAYNKYGDVYTHWKLERRPFSPNVPGPEQFNYAVINELCEFREKLTKKGAFLFISFQGLQSASFENWKSNIAKVEAELKKEKFFLLGTPERYKMPESLTFDTPNHLTKKGVDCRTQLLIEDFRTLSDQHLAY